jgi:hypothetical protein
MLSFFRFLFLVCVADLPNLQAMQVVELNPDKPRLAVLKSL